MPQQKLALMAQLCRAGYYFRHGGIKWMPGRVQSQGERKINNYTASPLSLKNTGFVNGQKRLISHSPPWPPSMRENRRWNQVEDRMGGDRAERETLCLQQTRHFAHVPSDVDQEWHEWEMPRMRTTRLSPVEGWDQGHLILLLHCHYPTGREG